MSGADAEKPKAAAKAAHAGHRERLRTRFMAAPAAVPDYEVLELILFAANTRGDTKKLAKALIDRFGFTRLRVHNPPMGFIRDPEAVTACVDFIAAQPARYVFLAVGAPQSEILAEAVIEDGKSGGVGLCIGSSLLFATGLVKRAPLWVQKAGLEAFYRLMQRPGTHFRRIFIESLPVIWILLRARFGGPGILRAAGDGPSRR